MQLHSAILRDDADSVNDPVLSLGMQEFQRDVLHQADMNSVILFLRNFVNLFNVVTKSNSRMGWTGKTN